MSRIPKKTAASHPPENLESQSTEPIANGDLPANPGRRALFGKVGGAAAAAVASQFLGTQASAGQKLQEEAQAATFSENSGNSQTGTGRRQTALRVRNHLVSDERARPIPAHPTNGDENNLPHFIGNFSKGLPHNATGQVDENAYRQLLEAMRTGKGEDFEEIRLGCPDPSLQRRLVDPQSALSFDIEGPDSHDLVMPPAPRYSGAETAAEMVELYWAALLRDVPFDQYGSDLRAIQAAAELSALSGFRGPRIGGQVTAQTLFRENLPGALIGPYVSQFLLLDVPFGAQGFSQAVRSRTPGVEYLTNFDDFLAVQRGCGQPVGTFDPVRRFVRSGRDMASYVQIDALAQAYFNALIVAITPPNPVPTFGMNPGFGGIGAAFDASNPYFGANPSHNQEGLGTFGPPYALTVMWEVANRAVRAQWYQKWAVHRRLRPEAFGGQIEVQAQGKAKYPIHPEVLNSQGLAQTVSRFGTHLLPQAFPEGSPLHPSYGAGHATVAGACVTILKALLDENHIIANPVAPSSDGTALLPFTGPGFDQLTVGGELNKLAQNIAFGRTHAGIHWRSDNFQSFSIGEQIAIEILEDQALAAHEPFAGFQVTKFDGTQIVVGANPNGTP